MDEGLLYKILAELDKKYPNASLQSLLKTIVIQNDRSKEHAFIETFSFMLNKDLVEISNPTYVKIKPLGREVFKAGGWIEYQKQEKDKADKNEQEEKEEKRLRQENMVLQNDNLRYQQTIREQDIELRQSTIDFTALQIKEIRNRKWWALAGSIGGGMLTFLFEHYKVIIEHIQELLKTFH